MARCTNKPHLWYFSKIIGYLYLPLLNFDETLTLLPIRCRGAARSRRASLASGSVILDKRSCTRGGHRVRSKTLDLPCSADDEFYGRELEGLRSTLRSRIDCLEQILRAFHDMADRDDIHQAANRLALVQEWIQD